MNLHYNKKDISKDMFDEILQDISKYESINERIGNSAISGSGFRQFTFTDGNRNLKVGYISVKSGSIVDMNEPKLVDANAIIIYDNEAKFIPSGEIKNISYFPELRQSFYENEDYRCRDADYKYHFEDGETLIAVSSPNPISRQDDLKIIAVEFIGGQFPQSWLLQTEKNGYLYLRERSGSIRLMDGLNGEAELIFHAFIGREHPGTHLKQHEVLNIISSMDYIKIIENYNKKVPEEAHKEYWGDYLDSFDSDINIFDETFDL